MSDFLYIVPEIIVLGSALALLVLGMFNSERRVRSISLVSVAVAAVLACKELIYFSGEEVSLFGGFVVRTAHTCLARAIVAVSGLFAFLLFSFAKRSYRYEFAVLMLFAFLGTLTLVEAHHFLSFYLSFELIGFASYILVCFNRSSIKASEAAIKFFVLGALSSCIMLYGISLVYGYASEFSLDVVSNVLGGGESLGATFGCALVLVGLLFKLGAVPFHMWIPDTYEGAPTVAVVFFTIVTKTAMILAFTGLMQDVVMPTTGFVWSMLLMAALSMVVGEFSAMQQKNIKRLFAYANIGHIGYVLAGMSTGYVVTFKPVLFYVVTYLLINVWIFTVLLRYDDEGFEITDVSGLATKNPFLAFAFVTAMFASAGLPPFSGFFAKYTLLKAIAGVDAFGVPTLACVVFLCLTSIIPCFYCFRIAKVVYFDVPTGEYPVIRRNVALSVMTFVAVILSLVVVLLRERII
ncbi:NADH-quinone oxidoreductase subunit N [Anaplasma phagocytophilum]|uniref:NADH-quinone oxidoreductase subunit N n=1 Tax=Anaplasma phagocytophilum TaxID=948 RepID=UPI00201ACD25